MSKEKQLPPDVKVARRVLGFLGVVRKNRQPPADTSTAETRADRFDVNAAVEIAGNIGPNASARLSFNVGFEVSRSEVIRFDASKIGQSLATKA